jgi:hypothetical protein
VSAAGAALGRPQIRAPLFSGDWQEVLPLPRRPAQAPPLTQLTVLRDPEGERKFRQFLLHLARETVTRATAGQPAPDTKQMPEPLRKVNVRVEVALWVKGRLIGLASAREGNVVGSTVRAAAMAAGDTRQRALSKDDLPDLRIAVSLQCQPQRIEYRFGVPIRSVPGALANFKKYVEIGVYGVGGIYRGRRVQLSACTPIVHNDPDAAHTMLALYRNLGVTPERLGRALRRITLYRFRCIEFVEHPKTRRLVTLYRGTVPFAVTDALRLGREGFRRMCRQGAEYMLGNQQADGLFRYMYYPALDRWSTSNNMVRQAGAAWAMSVIGRRLAEPRFTAAAVRAIKAMQSRVLWLDSARRRACIRGDKGDAKLGTAALTLCAILDLPADEQVRFRPFREGLTNAILSLQRSDPPHAGSFYTYFRPAGKIGSQDYAPGEALLALVKCFQVTGDRRCLEALQAGFPYYRKYFRQNPNLAFVPWQVQAYARMYDVARKHKLPNALRYSRYVFEMCDWLVEFQLTTANAGWPDCLGGVVIQQYHRPGIGTATYLEGLAEGLRVAWELDPTDRGRTYAQRVLYAMRMTGQLFFRPTDAYYVTRPKLAVGGFRFSLLSHSIRIDNCQHAVCALLAATDQIFRPTTQPATQPASTSSAAKHDGG